MQSCRFHMLKEVIENQSKQLESQYRTFFPLQNTTAIRPMSTWNIYRYEYLSTYLPSPKDVK